MRFIALFFLLFFCTQSKAQFYESLGEHTGIALDSWSFEIENIGSEINDLINNVLPSNQQNQFKILDFGSYLHNNSQFGELNIDFLDLIDSANNESTYYILIVKEATSNRLYDTYKIKVKLPESNNYLCLNDDLEYAISSLLESEMKNYPSIYSYSQVLSEASEYAKLLIEKAINCCSLDSKKSGCSLDCPIDIYKVARSFINAGYIELSNVTNIKVSEASSSYSGLASEIQINFDFGKHKNFDFNKDLGDFLYASTQSSIDIVHIDLDNQPCEFLIEHFSSSPLNKSNSSYQETIIAIEQQGKTILLSKIDLESASKSKISLEDVRTQKSVLIAPWLIKEVVKRTLMAGASVFLNIALEAGVEWFFSDDCTYEEAFILTWNNKSIWQILLYAFEGAFSKEIVEKLGIIMSSVMSGAIDYTLNPPSGNFNLDELFQIMENSLKAAIVLTIMGKYGPIIVTKLKSKFTDNLTFGLKDEKVLLFFQEFIDKYLKTNIQNIRHTLSLFPSFLRASINGLKFLKNDSEFLEVYKRYVSKTILPKFNDILKPYEEAVVRYYSGLGYYDLNKALRSGKVLDGSLKEFKEVLNTTLSKLPNHSNVVYRGLDEYFSLAAENWPVGNKIRPKEFYSTSTSQSVAKSFALSRGGNVVLSIESKTGKFIKELSDKPDELEVLFKSGSRFEVTIPASEMPGNPGFLIVHLKEI